MDKNFTPYEESLALKELGFDEPCFTWYWDDIGLYKGLEYGNHNKREHVVSAPLYQQAFRWFRENNKLHSHISLGISDEQDRSGLEYDEYIYVIEGLNGLDYDNYGESLFYKTPKEAELACLRKLIELVKK
jgi:hypothetical protein